MQHRIYRIPLEVLPERYTEQWAQWFPQELERCGFEYHEIPGDALTKKVETGKVLDAAGTMHFKASQLQRIAKLFKKGVFKNGDSFFVDDIQFPGIWAIKYMAALYDVEIFLFGYLHASSYTKEDFSVPMLSFLKSIERSWIFSYDKIFVGTQYHKNTFINNRFQHSYKHIAKDKLSVSGAPWNTWTAQAIAYKAPTYKGEKHNRIIFPNRFDIEKRPNVFLQLIDFLYNTLHMTDVEFLITTSRDTLTTDSRLTQMLEQVQQTVPTLRVLTGLSKTEYYAELAQSKLMVSTTIEENFGYCAIEALSLNTPILVPNDYSHPELLNGLTLDKHLMLYNIKWDAYINNFTIPSTDSTWDDENIIELGGKVVYALNYFKDTPDIYETTIKYNKSIENMCNTMLPIIEHGGKM